MFSLKNYFPTININRLLFYIMCLITYYYYIRNNNIYVDVLGLNNMVPACDVSTNGSTRNVSLKKAKMEHQTKEDFQGWHVYDFAGFQLFVTMNS